MTSGSNAVSCFSCRDPIHVDNVKKEYKNPKDVDISWLRFNQNSADTCVKLDLPNTSNSTQKCAHVVHAICLSYNFDSLKPQCPQCKEEWQQRSWSSLNQHANPTEKFCNDEEYRIEQLKKNSWLTEDSTLNQKLFLTIQVTEYGNMDFSALPEPFFKDICNLLKNFPHKASSFFSGDFEGRAIPYLEIDEIAKHYGETLCNHFPYGLYGKLKNTPERQEQLVKAVITHFSVIPKQVLHGKTQFVCKLLEHAKRFNSPEERTKELDKMLNLLHSVAFDWDAFFNTFHQFLAHNETFIKKNFATLYVRDALKRTRADALIRALFGPGKNNVLIYSFVVGQLTQDEKTKLKSALLSMKVYDSYSIMF